MRKFFLPLLFFGLLFSVSGADAVISDDATGDIVLNSSNSYSVERTFDGSGSSPESADLEWTWVENRSSASGETATFEFTRANDQSNTIELKVIDEESDTTSVTRTLRDQPEILGVPSDKTIDLDTEETFEVSRDGSGDYEVRDEFDDALSYTWDLESPDGDDDESGTGTSFTHDFTETGEYDLELNVTDDKDYYSVASVVEIDVENTSDGGSQGTQTQQEEEEPSEPPFSEDRTFGYVPSNGVGNVDFDDSPITGVSVGFTEGGSFRSLKSEAVEDQDELPNGTGEEPPGVAYRYIELERSGFENDEVNNVTFEFEVDKDWVNDNDIVEETIDLQRYSSGWGSLGAEKVDEDGDNLYFEAEADGFSVFSITGEEAETSFSVQVNAPGKVDSGQKFMINVTVENSGNVEGTYGISFDLANQSFSEDLTIGPDSSETASFETSIAENGTYDFELDGDSFSVQVGEVQQEEVDEEEVEGEGGLGIVLPLVFMLIIGSVGAMGAYVYSEEEQREEIIERIEEVFVDEEEEDESLGSDDYSFK